jgi:hypothetical protein
MASVLIRRPKIGCTGCRAHGKLTPFRHLKEVGMTADETVLSLTDDQRRDAMKAPDEVSAMLRLKALGLEAHRRGTRVRATRCAAGWLKAIGASVRLRRGRRSWMDYLIGSPNGFVAMPAMPMWFARNWRPRRASLSASGRLKRATAPLRCELVAAARATLRFETHPGEQLQIDFGERRVEIGGVAVKVFFFVATLGYSRRLHVRAYGHERQESWFDGSESAFRAFGGVPRDLLRRVGTDRRHHQQPTCTNASTKRKTHAIHEPPVTNRSARHIACVSIPPHSGHSSKRLWWCSSRVPLSAFFATSYRYRLNVSLTLPS